MAYLKEPYQTKLDLMETEIAIKLVKDTFEQKLSSALSLTRVSAPLFVSRESGLNDNLNGFERPVSFDIKETGDVAEVVHSLAKWKRHALHKYNLPSHTGLYTDMNAIRRDEECDPIHSIYVDQWDWEKVIDREDRNLPFLEETVRQIYGALLDTVQVVHKAFPMLDHSFLPDQIHFITSQDLEDLYPDLMPEQREKEIAKQYGAVFVEQIGGVLRSGQKHGGRAPDYDDWNLNGDILIYYPLLDRAFELSSMGVRVDADSMMAQLKAEKATARLNLPYHQDLLNGKLPLTIGGGIGQSRLCMLLLNKAHIGEVHASIWPETVLEDCEAQGIHLL